MLNECIATSPLDLTLNALAHPVRRALLERLRAREARVTELAEPFAMSLNAVSRHIQVLERAGLVRRRRVWREHYVALQPEPLEAVSAWIESTRAFWHQRLDTLEALLEADAAADTASSAALPSPFRNDKEPIDESENPSRRRTKR